MALGSNRFPAFRMPLGLRALRAPCAIGLALAAALTDYPASYWGRMSRTNLVGLSVPEGEHELLLRDLVFPPVWTRQFEPRVGGAVLDRQR